MSATVTATRPTPSPEQPPQPPRRSIGTITFGAVLVAVGIVGLLVALDVAIDLRVVAPAVLILLGAGVVASALRGERNGPTLGLAVVLGIVLAVGSVFTVVLDVPFRGGVGDRVHTAADISDVAAEYRLFAGTLTVDLRQVEFPAGVTELEVSTVLGEVRIRLPEDVAVAIETSVAAGSADVLGERIDGVAIDDERTTPDLDSAERRLELRVRIGLGQVHVTR